MRKEREALDPGVYLGLDRDHRMEALLGFPGTWEGHEGGRAPPAPLLAPIHYSGGGGDPTLGPSNHRNDCDGCMKVGFATAA
ncbi:hypothetical protein Sjap_005523 [Stephania japonica]|uniref:Uncharacterized protein n=1 Tax=Stephania japonica TaxID=461633 RepID=A0AAP0K6N9_9MAGN